MPINILDEIAAKTKVRVEAAKQKLPLSDIIKKAVSMTEGESIHNNFEDALKKPGISFICEVKKASPSKGIIAEHFSWLEIALDYETAGADAISVLTEPDYFLGSDNYLREIASNVKIPCLRKDFTIDPYQIYEAKTLGAGAVLLIVAMLDRETISSYIKIAEELKLAALVEAHNREEIEIALNAGAKIVGINNRNLKNFDVSLENSSALRNFIPEGIICIAESGIQTAEDVRVLSEMGFDAVLVGESLMKAEDRKEFLMELKSLI